jgi:hypothetical protein
MPGDQFPFTLDALPDMCATSMNGLAAMGLAIAGNDSLATHRDDKVFPNGDVFDLARERGPRFLQIGPFLGVNTRNDLVVRVIHDILRVPEFRENRHISLKKRLHFHLFETFDFSFHSVGSRAGLPIVLGGVGGDGAGTAPGSECQSEDR